MPLMDDPQLTESIRLLALDSAVQLTYKVRREQGGSNDFLALITMDPETHHVSAVTLERESAATVEGDRVLDRFLGDVYQLTLAARTGHTSEGLEIEGELIGVALVHAAISADYEFGADSEGTTITGSTIELVMADWSTASALVRGTGSRVMVTSSHPIQNIETLPHSPGPAVPALSLILTTFLGTDETVELLPAILPW